MKNLGCAGHFRTLHRVLFLKVFGVCNIIVRLIKESYELSIFLVCSERLILKNKKDSFFYIVLSMDGN